MGTVPNGDDAREADDPPVASTATEPSAALSPLARARLEELLGELLQRVDDVMDTQDRLRGLLDAVVSIGSDLSVHSVLERIVQVACQLTGAQYGALGVLGAGPDRRLREFVTHGLSKDQRARIGELPRGHGILGVIIDKPEPLRLTSLGEHNLSFGFPPDHPPMSSFLGVPIRIRDTVFGNLYLTEKRNGSEFTDEDEEMVVALAAAAGVVVENARLYEESELRQRWLEAGAEVTAAMLNEVSRDDALQLICDRAREVAGAEVAAVLLRHGGGRLIVKVVTGPSADRLVGTVIPTDLPRARDVLVGGAPVIVDDALGAGQVAASGFSQEDGWPEIGSLALLPMRSASLVAGILAMGWSTEREQMFRDTDLQLPASFAEQATLALHVAQAQDDRRRLAVLEDRDRIGRDLHDLVIQRLFAIGLALHNTSRANEIPGAVAERIAAAVDDVDATIQDIRRSIFELSTSPATANLRAELRVNIAVVTPALGFTPTLSTEGPVDNAIAPELQPHVLAVVREGLSNVARHAHATSAKVHLQVGNEVVLTVSDDGGGITVVTPGNGLRNMRERAESMGGTFEVIRGPAGGTVMVWRVPTR